MTKTAELFRTATGQRLHLRECPHVLGVDLLPAGDSGLDVCTWCDAELNEVGRTYHDTIEQALLDMGAAQHVVPELARHLRGVDHDKVFVPFSRSYVAVALDGRTVAVAGCTYVDFLDGNRVLLPGYLPGQRTGGHEVRDVWGAVCSDCRETRALNGACACD